MGAYIRSSLWEPMLVCVAEGQSRLEPRTIILLILLNFQYRNKPYLQKELNKHECLALDTQVDT